VSERVETEQDGSFIFDVNRFYYDAAGQVIQESKPGQAGFAQYVYGDDGQLVFRDRDADNAQSTSGVGKSGSGLDERVYALQDARQNITAIIAKLPQGTDQPSAWGVAERYAYSPDGELAVV